MNQKTFDDLIQKSRNQASAILFGGDLQGNTDTYLKAQPQLASQDEVPAPPKPIFREEGATVELDNRMNILLQPQVPRDPELEALNSYFNQRRVDEFARGQANHMVGEIAQKQAEIVASQFMRDEIDRRAGIRRQVLDMTGLTPAQIDQQMVAEAFAGINPRTMDMRERQVQDAVARFYSIQNIPAPATQQTTNPVPATTPSETAPAPAPAPMMEEEEMPDLEADEEVMEPSPDMPAGIDRMTTADLVEFVIANRVLADETTNSRTRELLSRNSLKQKGKAILRRVVEDFLIRRMAVGGGGGGGAAVGNPAL
jgi:hypothetical protein